MISNDDGTSSSFTSNTNQNKICCIILFENCLIDGDKMISTQSFKMKMKMRMMNMHILPLMNETIKFNDSIDVDTNDHYDYDLHSKDMINRCNLALTLNDNAWLGINNALLHAFCNETT